jgi:small-conductance mechanosensitive channel
MEENQIAQLLIEVWDDVQKPAIFWQIGVLAVCLLIAGLISRQVKAMLRRRASAEPGSVRDVGEEGLRRVVFPLSALLLVVLARVTLDKWHHVNLLKLAVPLLLAMAVIRLTVHALKRAFPGRLAGVLRALLRLWRLGVVACTSAGCCPR